MQIKYPFFLLIMLSVSGCAMQEGDFPSLAKRPYEDGQAIAPAVQAPPTPVSSLPAPVQAAVTEAVMQSDSAHEKFMRNLPGVKRRVNAARGSAISSESWVVAQMDLAALEMIRTPSVSALADIDDLYLKQLTAEYEAASSGGAALINERRAQISAQVRNQQDEIEAMKAKLR